MRTTQLNRGTKRNKIKRLRKIISHNKSKNYTSFIPKKTSI
ncbi:hypothetical protein PROVRETT_09778 [Providencia rettgeri DSM 1131]|nr:hypothetical protein PROVRETT_09778 [Providencia rettgeri DSM 1131]